MLIKAMIRSFNQENPTKMRSKLSRIVMQMVGKEIKMEFSATSCQNLGLFFRQFVGHLVYPRKTFRQIIDRKSCPLVYFLAIWLGIAICLSSSFIPNIALPLQWIFMSNPNQFVHFLFCGRIFDGLNDGILESLGFGIGVVVIELAISQRHLGKIGFETPIHVLIPKDQAKGNAVIR